MIVEYGGEMAEPSLADQMAALNSMLRVIEVRLALSRPPVEGIEEFRIVLDDMRLRLWGLLSGPGGDMQHSQERFRIRRAIELCRGLSADLKAGAVSGRQPGLGALTDAASELRQSIERARTNGQ
jgi:hypothetical protein